MTEFDVFISMHFPTLLLVFVSVSVLGFFTSLYYHHQMLKRSDYGRKLEARLESVLHDLSAAHRQINTLRGMENERKNLGR